MSEPLTGKEALAVLGDLLPKGFGLTPKETEQRIMHTAAIKALKRDVRLLSRSVKSLHAIRQKLWLWAPIVACDELLDQATRIIDSANKLEPLDLSSDPT